MVCSVWYIARFLLKKSFQRIMNLSRIQGLRAGLLRMVRDSFNVFIGCAWLVIRFVVATSEAEHLHRGVYDTGLLPGTIGRLLLLL